MAIDERGVNLKVTATNETQQGFEGVKQSAREMANTVTQESGRASQSVGKIGDGGQQASQKVERSTRSMIQSIQRTTAAMEAGSRTSAKYYETLAKQRGVDPEVLRPYLNQLEEVRLKQEQASAALGAGTIQFNQYGMSAKQTAAALRGVPAQLTDIFVSLQGGQRPMTVLIQQGGQLKDMFGGIVPAARALGSTLLGMINPLTATAAAIGGLYLAYRTGAQEAERFHASLVLTGNAAGTSVDQLMTMASRIDSVASTQRRAASALNEFVSSSRVGVRNLEELTLAAIKWEDATGTAISETVKQFEELARAPLEASTKLDQALGHLTGSLRDQIRELEEQGRMIDAANLAQKAFADTINERAPQIVQQIGYIEQGWRAVKSAISEAVDAMAGIGRPQTTFEQLIDAETRLQQLQDGAAERGAVRRQRQIAEQEAIVASLRGQYAVEQSILTLQQQGAEERARQQERERNLREYLGEPDRMTRAQQMQKDLEEERKIYEARKKDAAGNAQALQQIEQAHQVALKNIRERYKEKAGSGGISTTQTELARLNALLEAERQREEALHSLGLAQANLNEGEKLAIQYAEKLKLATDEKTKAQLTANKALAEEYGARKRANDVFEKDLKDRQSAIDAAKKQTERLRDEIETYGMGKSAIEAMTIARLEERLAVDEALGASAGTIESLKQEIATRKELLNYMRTKEQLDAQLKEWQAWEREVDRIFDQLGQSLTDQLFEGGKNARDMLKDMFKALTLRVVVQPMLAGLQGMVTQQIGGLLGFSDPRQQGGGMLGTAQNLYSGYNAITGGLNSTLGNAAQWLGQKIGSEALTSFGLGLSGTTAATGIASIGAGLGASLGASIGTSAAAMTTTTFSAALGGGALIPGLGVGVAGGGVGAGIGAAGTASAATTGGAATLGSALGTALPWIGGALAIGSAFGLFGGRTPTTRRMQRVTSEYGDGEYHITSRDGRQAAGTEDIVRQLAESAVQSTNELFERVGVAASVNSLFAITESSYKGDRQGVASGGTLRIGDALVNFGLQDLYNRTDMTKSGFGGWSEAEMLPRLEMDLQLSVLSAFQAVGDALPRVLYGMLEGVDIRSLGAEQAQALAVSFQGVIEQVTGLQEAVERLPFAQLRDLSFDAAANLIQFAGGLEQLDAGMTSYFQNFYSEEEKLEWAAKQIGDAFGELGLTMPDVTQGAELAKAAYRDLVESLDVTTEEGQRAYATLMALSGGFAELVVGMDELNNAVVETARSAADIARERESLERQLLALQGNTAELRRRELAALDESNRALQEHIWALQDQADAAQAAQDAAQAQASAISGAWANFGTMAGLAAQHTGNGAGLQAQLSVAQASYAGADNTADRVAALQEIIRLEQSIWGLQQEGRKAEADAARASIEASQQQLSNANKLLNAAQSLGNYAQSLFGGKDSGMSGADRMQFLQSEYETLLARARSGDADAMGKLQGASSEYLSAAQQMAGSQEDYSVLSGTIASELATVSAIQAAAASSQASMLERQIKKAQEQAAAISSAQFEVSDQTRILIESLLGESTDGFKDTLRSMSELIDQEKATLAAIRGWPATLNGIMSQTLVPSINGIAQSAANSAVSAYIAANAAAEEQRLRRAAELAAQALRAQIAAMQAAAEAAKEAAAKEGGVTVPALAVGTNYVPKTQLALLHEGEAVLPRAFNPWAGGVMSGQSNSELIAEVRALREEVASLREPMEQTAAATTEHKDMFENASAGGNALAVEVMA